MMEEEDDIVFDRAALLPTQVSPKKSHKGDRKTKIFTTLCLCLAFFTLGLMIAIPGPTLLDLQEQTNTNTSEISQIFTGRSVGYLVGSMVGGVLFDHVNQSCLLSLILLITAVATAIVPWCKSLLLMVLLISGQGLSMGFLDTGGNVLCLSTWGRQSAPHMQALHFSFGVGAFVAPLLATPFLSHSINVTTNDTFPVFDSDPQLMAQVTKRIKRDNGVVGGIEGNKTVIIKKKPQTGKTIIGDDPDGDKMGKKLRLLTPQPVSPVPPTVNINQNNSVTPKIASSAKNVLSSATTTTSTTTTTTTTAVPTTTTTTTTASPKAGDVGVAVTASVPSIAKEVPCEVNCTVARSLVIMFHSMSRVQFAYLIIACFSLVISFMFIMVCCITRGTKALRQNEFQREYIIREDSRSFRIQILILLFIFYFLYVGMEVAYGGFIMTFAVTHMRWSKEQGTLLTSVFWGSFAAGRGVAVFLSRCVSPAVMLVCDLVITVASLSAIVMGLEQNEVTLWVCTATLGIGFASIFPTGITWVERYMHVSGKTTAVFVVGSALGEMVMPLLVGYLFENMSAMWLMYVLLGASVFSVVIFIIMQNLASNMGERYEKLVNVSLQGLGPLDGMALMNPEESDMEETELESLSDMPVSATQNGGPHVSNHSAFSHADIQGRFQNKKVTFDLDPVSTAHSSQSKAAPSKAAKHSKLSILKGRNEKLD